MQRTLLMIAVLALGCGKKTEAPTPKTYKLSTRADQESPPGGVTVTITWPAGWTEEKVDKMSPEIKIAGADGIMEGATLILRYCKEGLESAACFDETIATLWKDEKVEKTPVGDRLWFRTTIGKIVMGGLFVYHPATKTTVACQVMVKPEHESKLADARKACEGLTLQ